MRDDFSEEVKAVLGRRVNLRCSKPGCYASTSGPQVDPAKALNVGVAAHITAASPGGPRYDGRLSPEKRQSAENGIWLCQTCAKLVDNDPTRFTVELLNSWKRWAEEGALMSIGTGHGAMPHPSDVALFEALLELLPSASDAVDFLRHHDLGQSFDNAVREPISRFAYEWDNADHEFQDLDLEAGRISLLRAVQTLLREMAANTFPEGRGVQSIPKEWRHEQPDRYAIVVKRLNDLSDEAFTAHQDLIRLGRARLRL